LGYRPRVPAKLPPPLPPETRTVGQLVAESMRLYGERFWLALPLGIPLAVTFQLIAGQDAGVQIPILWAASPLLTLSYLGAAALVSGAALTRRSVLTAFVTGLIVFLPAPVLLRLFLLPAVAWLALFGLVVPVAVIERTGFRETFVRARRLALADYVHALGSLAALTIVFYLSVLMLGVLLHGQGDLAIRLAAFLAHSVVAPLLFIGSALLYFDQRARVSVSSPGRPRRRSDADVPAAVDAERPGRPDAEVES
jgi:hypothetical protein